MREVQPCGTSAGYHRHRKRKEKPCEPCFLAQRAYQIAYKTRTNPNYKSDILFPPEARNPCGTEGAYQRHRKNGELPCDACKAAHSQRVTAWCKDNRPYQADRWQTYRYGISQAEKIELLNLQGRKCAIGVTCDGQELSIEDAVTEHLHVDNLPNGSSIRGIACDPCNRLLALLGDGLDDMASFREKLRTLDRYLTETFPETQRRLAAMRSK